MKRKLQCSQGNTQGPERSSDYYSGPSGPSEPGGGRGQEGMVTTPDFGRNRNKTFSLKGPLRIIRPSYGLATQLLPLLHQLKRAATLAMPPIRVCKQAFFFFICNGLLERLFSFTQLRTLLPNGCHVFLAFSPLLFSLVVTAPHFVSPYFMETTAAVRKTEKKIYKVCSRGVTQQSQIARLCVHNQWVPDSPKQFSHNGVKTFLKEHLVFQEIFLQ